MWGRADRAGPSGVVTVSDDKIGSEETAPKDSICEVFVNGVLMVRCALDGAWCGAVLSDGISPLPVALRQIADELEAQNG